MKLETNEVEAGHCLICRLPATLVDGDWHCLQHFVFCEECQQDHPEGEECDDELIDEDDFTTGGYGGMYQR
jgi:hypothetical protein